MFQLAIAIFDPDFGECFEEIPMGILEISEANRNIKMLCVFSQQSISQNKAVRIDLF